MKEINEENKFENWINSEDFHENIAVQCINLNIFESKIRSVHIHNCIFLACTCSNELAGYLVSNGNFVIPDNSSLLFDTHRAELYSPEELFEGFEADAENGYFNTRDYKIYLEYLKGGKDKPKNIMISLHRRLHDHSITDALNEEIENKKVVAIMGGHGMERNDSFYISIARISRELTRSGYLLVSGGGPGAMEATHLGAYFSTFEDKLMDEAIEILKKRPQNAPEGKEYADKDWLHRAIMVIEKFPLKKDQKLKSKSIGIPTWLYGHEPPAAFATHIAKYFANSVREEGLLAIAKYGVIFAPGSAGTTQEIFQDACQNHYAAYNTNINLPSFVSPMILMGKDHWTKKRPVWNLISEVAQNRPYGKILKMTDDENEIISCIKQYNPEQFRFP